MRGLTDRRAECGVLDGLVEAVCAGESRVLVVHGEPGLGKTALREYLADRATGYRVLRVSGVQWEMELALAADFVDFIGCRSHNRVKAEWTLAG